MKRLISLFLTLAMAGSMLLLPACSGGSDEKDTTPPANTAAPAETNDAAAGEAGRYTGPSMTLTMGSNFGSSTYSYEYMEAFCDYIEEQTDGKVTFQRHQDSTLFTSNECLSYVSTGAVDVIPLGHLGFATELPLLNFLAMVYVTDPNVDGSQYIIDYYNYMLFENEETSALLKAEAERNNIVYLSTNAGGPNVMLADVPFNSLADLAGTKFGMVGNEEIWESFGLSIISINGPDMYDGFSRGIIDSSERAISPLLNNRWYEVAKYIRYDGSYAAGNFITVNLDRWNTFDDSLKTIFQEAADMAAELGIQLDRDYCTQADQILTDNGCDVGTMPAEDIQAMADAMFEGSVKNCRFRAEQQGLTEEMETMIAEGAAYLGQEVPEI